MPIRLRWRPPSTCSGAAGCRAKGPPHRGARRHARTRRRWRETSCRACWMRCSPTASIWYFAVGLQRVPLHHLPHRRGDGHRRCSSSSSVPGSSINLRLRQGKGQPIRTDGPQSHLAKRGTPTMGGLMILSGLWSPTLLWANPAQSLCLDRAGGDRSASARSASTTTILKVTKQSHKGFSGKARLRSNSSSRLAAC
jgi:hypothetical protein